MPRFLNHRNYDTNKFMLFYAANVMVICYIEIYLCTVYGIMCIILIILYKFSPLQLLFKIFSWKPNNNL